MVVGRERSVSAAIPEESRSLKRRKQRGRFIPQPVPEATNMDHSSAGMTPPPTARPRGPAATSGVQDDDAATVSSAGDLATLAEQAATPGSGAHASPYSFLRMHTVLFHGIIDLGNKAQESLRTLEQGQHDLREQRDQAQARLNDQKTELRDLASRLTAQTEKATELESRVQESDQALEVMTAEVNEARDYTAHSVRLVAGKEGDLRRSLEAERETSQKARQDRDRAFTTAGELQEQLRVAQDRIAQLEAQPLRFSASNPAWDILLAENQDLREAAKTQKARAKDSRVRNKILRSQTETFQADALQKLGALESRVQGYESQDQRHREDLVQLEEELLREKQVSHDLERKLQAFQESEWTSARGLLHANEHFQDAVPPGPDVQCLGEHALPVMWDALKESSTPSSGVLGVDVVEASPGSGDKGSTLSGPAGAKAPVPPSPSRSAKRSASGGRSGETESLSGSADNRGPARVAEADRESPLKLPPYRDDTYVLPDRVLRKEQARDPFTISMKAYVEDKALPLEEWLMKVVTRTSEHYVRGSAEVNTEVEAAHWWALSDAYTASSLTLESGELFPGESVESVGVVVCPGQECQLAGVYQGRFPFVVDHRSHPPEGSQWARGMPRPAGIPPTGYTPPLPNTIGVPKTATMSGAPTTFSASGVQSTFPAPEMVDLLSNSATDTNEETVVVDL
ncbi:hypothetical protein DYB38_004433 [Aphanomyces astaci]|uniref:Uncharacterized protein n=1 Tax=Aphanomyces astaci TaxID=112090 RepID=A0A397CFJ3_APHAT|nr:hypothetical protein DYB38_004433 [Aphanomyces astaci]